jgi:hypothetical protein
VPTSPKGGRCPFHLGRVLSDEQVSLVRVRRLIVGPGSAIPNHWRELSDGHSNVGYDLQSAHRPIGRADAMFEGDCALIA